MSIKNYNKFNELNETELRTLWESVCGTFFHVYENDEFFYRKLQDYKPINGEAINYFMDFFISIDPFLGLNEVLSWDKEIDFNEVFEVKDNNEINDMDMKIAISVSGFISEYLDLPNY